MYTLTTKTSKPTQHKMIILSRIYMRYNEMHSCSYTYVSVYSTWRKYVAVDFLEGMVKFFVNHCWLLINLVSEMARKEILLCTEPPGALCCARTFWNSQHLIFFPQKAFLYRLWECCQGWEMRHGWNEQNMDSRL